MKWDDHMSDRDSDVFQSLANLTERSLDTILQDSSSAHVEAKVVIFSRDEISDSKLVVTCGIILSDTLEIISENKIKEKVLKNLRKSNGRLGGQLELETHSITVSKIIKNCQDLGCRSKDCEFSVDEIQFFCVCELSELESRDCVNQTDLFINNTGTTTSDVDEVYKTVSVIDKENIISLEEEGSGKVIESDASATSVASENKNSHLEDEYFLMDNDSEVKNELKIDSQETDEEETTTVMDIFISDKPSQSGECSRKLERYQLCDNIEDCDNKEDEHDCEYGHCHDSEFSCLSGRCIPSSWKCDGRPDCDSGEDELACASSCDQTQFKCREGKCIEKSLLCDGVEDCGDGDDEEDDICVCDEDEYECEYGGGCIRRGGRCDGVVQCADRSDEWNCVTINNKTLQIRFNRF